LFTVCRSGCQFSVHGLLRRLEMIADGPDSAGRLCALALVSGFAPGVRAVASRSDENIHDQFAHIAGFPVTGL
jgi:hypothetical protein